MQTFVYDEKEAVKAFGFIDTAGIYDFTIVEAYINTAKTGSKSFRLELVTDSGQPLTHDIWIIGKEGKELERGQSEVKGKLLASVNLKGVKPEQKKIQVEEKEVNKEGKETGKRIKVTKAVDAYPALIGKQLKAAIQMQEDAYNGKIILKPVIIAWFTSDGLSPKEVATNVNPDDRIDIFSMTDKLTSQPVKYLSESAKASVNAGLDFMPDYKGNSTSTPIAMPDDDFDDEIPF